MCSIGNAGLCRQVLTTLHSTCKMLVSPPHCSANTQGGTGATHSPAFPHTGHPTTGNILSQVLP